MSREIRPTGKGAWGSLPKNEVIRVALGNVSAFDIVLVNVEGGIFIALVTGSTPYGAYVFRNYAYGSYVAEKLNVTASDGRHLADLINEQLGINVEEPQGTYEESHS